MKKSAELAPPEKYLNLFWPYGSHAYWENNITGALAKYLHLSPERVRKSFIRNCLKIKDAGKDGTHVSLQSREIPQRFEGIPKKNRHAILISPSALMEKCLSTLDDKPHQEKRDHCQPDFLLYNRGFLGVFEVKLWKGAAQGAKRQVEKYRKKFDCGTVRTITLEDVYNWLQKPIGTPSEHQETIREHLLGYLEDLGAIQVPVFRRRHLATKDGHFLEEDILRIQLGVLMESLNKQMSDVVEFRTSNFSIGRREERDDVYIKGLLYGLNKETTVSIAFHADKAYVRFMSFFNSPDAFKERTRLNWSEALSQVEPGFSITLKKSILYSKRSQDHNKSSWPVTVYKKPKSTWQVRNEDETNGKTLHDIEGVCRFLNAQSKRWDRKPLPDKDGKTNRRYAVVFIFEFGGKDFAFDDLVRRNKEEVFKDIKARVRQLQQFYEHLYGPLKEK